jgi:hypothetical protein
VDCQIPRVREEKAGACEWERAAVDVVSSAPRSANWLLQRLYVWPCLISFFWLLQRLYVWPCLISFLCKVVELSSACGILQRPIKHLGESDIAGTGMCPCPPSARCAPSGPTLSLAGGDAFSIIRCHCDAILRKANPELFNEDAA